MAVADAEVLWGTGILPLPSNISKRTRAGGAIRLTVDVAVRDDIAQCPNRAVDGVHHFQDIHEVFP